MNCKIDTTPDFARDLKQLAKEEFQAKMERGMEDYRQGKCDSLLPGEDLTTYLRRRGYDI